MISECRSPTMNWLNFTFKRREKTVKNTNNVKIQLKAYWGLKIQLNSWMLSYFSNTFLGEKSTFGFSLCCLEHLLFMPAAPQCLWYERSIKKMLGIVLCSRSINEMNECNYLIFWTVLLDDLNSPTYFKCQRYTCRCSQCKILKSRYEQENNLF